jgi:N-carbamoylputrescine amidase
LRGERGDESREVFLMKIAMAASGFINCDTEYNKNIIKKTARKYSGQVDMILFGETFLQGFYALNWDKTHDSGIAVSIDAPVITELREAARDNSIAISFGYIEKVNDVFYSSQLTIGEDGKIVDNYRRISPGWKEPQTDNDYREGEAFHTFLYKGIEFSVALCGDLWHDEYLSQMIKINPNVLLWPVYTDFNYEEWNSKIKYEYAARVAELKSKVLYVNSICLDKEGVEIARGGAAYFENGRIIDEVPAGREELLIVTL